MGEVLLQEDDSEYARESEAQYKDSGNCEFDKSLDGMRLRPISFISISTVSPQEKSRHIFSGETAALRWAIGKFMNYLWGA